MRADSLLRLCTSLLLPLALVAACEAPEGTGGPQGPAGPQGPQGAPGPVGMTMALSSTCDAANIGTITAPGSTITRTAWYAKLEISGLDFRKAPRVSALLCDRQCWGADCDITPTPACLGSIAGCKGSGVDVRPLSCVPAPAALNPQYTQIAIDDGAVIVGCGLHVVQTGANAQESGVRYKQVFVSVQQ